MKPTDHKDAKAIINSLTNGNFYCGCPCGCGEEISLKDAGLFYLDDFSRKGTEARQALLDGLKEQRFDLKERERNMKARPQIRAKSVNIGLILERIAPGFDSFPFEHNDCRSLFDPIDYVIFEGLSKSGVVSKILFTELKTGRGRLTFRQKEIKDLIQTKKVEFKTY